MTYIITKSGTYTEIKLNLTQCRHKAVVAKADVTCVSSDASKQRTKTISNSCEPQWRETLVYRPFDPSDVHAKSLEITLFDYDRVHSAQYIGEVSQCRLHSV